MRMCRIGRIAAASAAAFALLPLEAQAPGDLWQVTTKMLMQGMNMPGQSMQVCAPKRWTKPPGGEREGCTSSGFAMKGNVASWDVVCTGPQSMKGHGEVTVNGDSYAGTIKFAGDGFAMTIELSGKKLSDCANPQ